MEKLQDALYKVKQRQAQANYQNPNRIEQQKVTLPVDVGQILDIDLELIQVLLAYKNEIQTRAEESKAEEFYQKRSEPSQEAIELKSFLYDHLDDFEEVLNEDNYNELESLIMSIG